MTSYTANLTITAKTAYTTWYEASAIACTVTATAWHWYTAAFFSPAAQRRYEWVGQLLGCTVALCYLYAKRWVDAEVATSLPAEPMPTPEVEEDSFSPEVNPLPVAIAPLEGMTLAQLRKACIEHNATLPAADPRRIARAARLTKAEAIAALAA